MKLYRHVNPYRGEAVRIYTGEVCKHGWLTMQDVVSRNGIWTKSQEEIPPSAKQYYKQVGVVTVVKVFLYMLFWKSIGERLTISKL